MLSPPPLCLGLTTMYHTYTLSGVYGGCQPTGGWVQVPTQLAEPKGPSIGATMLVGGAMSWGT